MKSILEVCAFGIQSSIIAERAGAARVELCDNPIEGGTTPSYGMIKKVRAKISIELFPILRPRSMNYFYDDDDWAIILEDVGICKQLGCDGISVGIQKSNGDIDADRMRHLVDLAYPMVVTSNRVIDTAPNPYESLEILIDAGCKRVLTSGLASTAPEGAAVLKELVMLSKGRISIMPGAGVNSGNISQLRSETGAHEFHSSARKATPNLVSFINPRITDAGNMYVADEEEVRKMVIALNR